MGRSGRRVQIGRRQRGWGVDESCIFWLLDMDVIQRVLDVLGRDDFFAGFHGRQEDICAHSERRKCNELGSRRTSAARHARNVQNQRFVSHVSGVPGIGRGV